MSKDPKAEVIFKMKILANSRPKDDTDQDWAVRILSVIMPQMLGRIIAYLTHNVELGDRGDGKPLPFDDVIDGLSAVLCENLCSTWFMAGGSKEHLLKAIDEMYTVFEEEMTSATESPLDPDGDIPVPTVTGVGHA